VEENPESLFLEPFHETGQENAVLEAAPAQDDPVEPRSFAEDDGHGEEGLDDRPVKRKGENVDPFTGPPALHEGR